MTLSPSPALDISMAMDTDVGRKREQNQDAIGHHSPTEPEIQAALGHIYVLADGVGGLAGGDLASQYAVSTIISSYYDEQQESDDPQERLAHAMAEANTLIHAEGQGQTGMATTVVVAVLRGRELIVGSVGDSPAFLVRDGEARKLTLDHTLAEERREAGEPLPEGDPDGRKLVRALGRTAAVKVDIISGRVRGGDYVVLCSDGLTRYVGPEEIERAVSRRAPDRAVQRLIALANERGGADNVSVIVLRLSDEREVTAALPPIRDPMEDWGRPRRMARAKGPSGAEEAEAAPTLALPAALGGPLRDLWRLVRGNTLLTLAGLAALLVVFLVIMLLVAGSGGPEEQAARAPSATSLPAAALTATARSAAFATAQIVGVQTTDALQAAEAATQAFLTLTPPTPIPTGGPQMVEGAWFKVREGDAIPTFEEAAFDAPAASALEPGENYRVSSAVHGVEGGPWYQVVDNQGVEMRWVTGPSLHARVVAVDTAGLPLPTEQQPFDAPPPDELPTATPTPAESPTPTATVSGTPPTPTPPTPSATPRPTRTATAAPQVPYGAESWTPGTRVTANDDLKLCRTPDVSACEEGAAVVSGEEGVIVSGPVGSGEHWWWEVELQDGRAGWIAQVLLG